MGSSAPDGASDYAAVLDLERGSGQAYVREALEPLPLDFSPLPTGVVRPAGGGWNEMLLSTNREQTIPTTGETLAYETFPVGVLRRGTWDPAADDFDSLATWRADGNDVVTPGTSEVSPTHVPLIDLVGHRYIVRDAFTLTLGVEARVLF